MVVRYERVESDFTAEIQCDEDGIAMDDPGIARRLGG